MAHSLLSVATDDRLPSRRESDKTMSNLSVTTDDRLPSRRESDKTMSNLSVATDDRQPAFPGAEGFGMYTTGGRGTVTNGVANGKVYHVTTLEDDGTTSLQGSLRWANAQSGPRTIVFDVSGTIRLKKALQISPNTTLAGQSAPGDGICIADYPVTLSSNNIIRFIRFRLGNEALKSNPSAHEGDGLGSLDKNNIIVDHCSVSWSIDECLSVYGGDNLTVQWCIASQSLRVSGHSKGAHGYGGNWGGAGASYHHNLIAHCESRVPRLGPRTGTQTREQMDLRNNVFYNWAGEGCYGGEGMKVNIVNNYYKPGPGTATLSSTKQKRIANIGIRTTEYTKHDTSSPNGWDVMWHVWGKFYVSGNVNPKYSDVTNDNWTYGIYNQITNSKVDNTFTQETKDTMRVDTPIPFEAVTTHSAENAYEKVLAYAGASLHRDAVDELIISDTRNGVASYTGDKYNLTKNADGTYTATLVEGSKYGVPGIINSQDDIKEAISGADSPWPTLTQTAAPADSDNDGIPDSWESANGLNPNDASDSRTVASDGYTNLEHYLNGIVADIMTGGNEGGTNTGITVVTSSNKSMPADNGIYTVSGTLIKKDASQHDVSLLQKGIYIMNGKKMIIR